MKNPANVRREMRDGQTKLRAFFLAGCATAALMSGVSIAHADGGRGGGSSSWTEGGSGYAGEDGEDATELNSHGGGGGGAGGGNGGDGGPGDADEGGDPGDGGGDPGDPCGGDPFCGGGDPGDPGDGGDPCEGDPFCGGGGPGDPGDPGDPGGDPCMINPMFCFMPFSLEEPTVPGVGGAGGTEFAPDGADGTDGINAGGGGGGGGYHGTETELLDNSGTLTGGDGGNGGDGTGESMNGPAGGGGGAGGYGAVITASGRDNVNREGGLINGGNGGNGGNSATSTAGTFGPSGGGGGDGGVGVQLGASSIEFLNEGTITGGDGGNGGNAGTGNIGAGTRGSGGDGGHGVAGSNGTITNNGTITGGRNGVAGSIGSDFLGASAGNGIYGEALTIVNSGTIAGGDSQSSDNTFGSAGTGIAGSGMTVTNRGTIQAGDEGAGTAIYFLGGTNRLTLEEGSTILGKVIGSSGGSNDTLVLGGSGNARFDLTGIGRQYSYFDYFEKTGTGTWTVTGTPTSPTEMLWTINGGTLAVGDAETPDTQLASAMKIELNGVLSGTGTVTGIVWNHDGGVVMPGMGNAPGRLVIDGIYYQELRDADEIGNLRILVTPTKASQLAVTESAVLGGTVQMVYAPGVYEERTYTILTAGSVIGTFDEATSQNLPDGFEQSLEYSETAVDLILANAGSNVIAPTDSTTFSATGSTVTTNSYFSTFTVFKYVGKTYSRIDVNTGFLTKPIKIAMAGDGGLAELLSPAAAPLYNAWFTATGSLSDLDGSGATAGFKTKAGGFMGGIDRDFGDGVTAGVALGFDQTYIDEDSGGSGHVSSPRIMLYGSHEAGPLAFAATVGYAHHFIDTRRFVTATAQTAEADHGGDEFSAGLQASYRFDMEDVTVTPKAGAVYTYLSEESFSESGAPGFNLNVASKNTESLRPFVGVDLATSFTTEGGTVFTPQLSLDYSRETMADAPSSTVSVGGGTFTVNGLEPSKNRVTAGLSLDVEMDERLTLRTGYSAVLPTGNLFAQSLEVGLTYKF